MGQEITSMEFWCNFTTAYLSGYIYIYTHVYTLYAYTHSETWWLVMIMPWLAIGYWEGIGVRGC
jgi:endonuclease/exonuclease/phosphatase (EEP) superfamily protein YafD